jgi:type II secretory pathway component PulF
MKYRYTALTSIGGSDTGVVEAKNAMEALELIHKTGVFVTQLICIEQNPISPQNKSEANTPRMTLAQALKRKNRLAGELVRTQQILQRENSRRSDNVSTTDRNSLWDQVLRISDELGKLKDQIARANVPIYAALERMAELKSRIAFVSNLPMREGEEIVEMGQGSVTYTWNSFFTHATVDKLVGEIQMEIDSLQDQIDAHNATTII